MSSSPMVPERERILELHADHALQGLETGQQAELDRLLEVHADLNDDSLELAAAALDFAFVQQSASEEMPDSLRQRLRSVPLPTSKPDDSGTERDAPASAASASASGAPVVLSGWGKLGWLAAAAAVLWMASTQWLVSNPSDREQFDQLVASSSDLMKADWQGTDDPAGSQVQGELVWSNDQQRGFMLFQGLERNDPSKDQYQLWIFDRSQEHPVDGGVFDSTGGEILIPIDAKILVKEPFQFAVTVERPGGVVVSKRERIVSLAVPETPGP